MNDLLKKLPLQSLGLGKSRKTPMGRFVVFGLPRSGTTFLSTLLNSHRAISCSGEQFNPWSVVDFGKPDDRSDVVLIRDAEPLEHMRKVFAAADARGVEQAGFKFMLGHNVKVLRALADDPELRIIYVWRENRLAQVASMLKAMKSKRWAQTRVDAHVSQTVEARPRAISQRWHEMAAMDFLASQWLATIPNPVLTLEYCALFKADTPNRLCDFLGVEPDPKMKSPLVKQGSNRVIDRFDPQGPIAHYFTKIGREEWLGEEL